MTHTGDRRERERERDARVVKYIKFSIESVLVDVSLEKSI